MQISKWGNSLSVRLPKDVVDALRLQEGDDVAIAADNPRAVAIDRDRRIEEALAVLRKYRGRMPVGFKFDREEANER
ncbi:MAG: AbrB/MazE/SpoVT family DNA-binding domain-containing protein [Alphaproteobacteria bacterium]|nr:AbrB/MazE/SpoVT family DNA-binding domain-containing protein [Alphaproteobacteria bacterium]